MAVEMMKLRVMVPNLVGKETVLINVSSSCTVLELKRLLAAEISGHLKIEDLKVIFLGRLLPDLSLLSYWLQPNYPDGSSNRVVGDISLGQNLLCLKSDSDQHQQKISTHTLHLAYPPPPASPFTLNKNSFPIEESSTNALGEQQQAQLAELYSTYLSLYWQSVISQSEGSSDRDQRRISDMLANTAPPAPASTPPPAPATIVTPPPASASTPPASTPLEAYLEVLWGLLTCLLNSVLIIAILHFYGSLNLVKFALALAFACLVIFLGKEAMRNDEVVEEEEVRNDAEASEEELVDAEAEDEQDEGTLAILISNVSLFFSSVFPEGIHLRV